MDYGMQISTDTRVCPICEDTSVEFDFHTACQACHICGWTAGEEFETLGRVIGGGPEAGRMQVATNHVSLHDEDDYTAYLDHNRLLDRDSSARRVIYNAQRNNQSDLEIDNLTQAIGFPDLNTRTKGILNLAKREFNLRWGKHLYPYVVAAVILAAREARRGLHVSDFIGVAPNDITAKPIHSAILKLSPKASPRDASVFVERIFNHLSLYIPHRSLITVPQSRIKKFSNPKNTEALKSFNMSKAKDLCDRLTRRFDPHVMDEAVVAVATTLISVEHQLFGNTKSFHQQSFLEDMNECFKSSLSLNTIIKTAKAILNWVEVTWKSLSVEKGWKLNLFFQYKSNSDYRKRASKDPMTYNWGRNESLAALRHVDLLPLPNNFEERVYLGNYASLSSTKGSRTEPLRKIEIAANGYSERCDESKNRQMQSDKDVVYYRRLLYDGYTMQDLLETLAPTSHINATTRQAPSRSLITDYASKLGMTPSELLESDNDIPDSVLFGEMDPISGFPIKKRENNGDVDVLGQPDVKRQKFSPS